MVLVFLNSIQFEADKFETRTMPTPDMKGKEMIYWIRLATPDKRLFTELQRFLDSNPKSIDLRVPSTFVSAKTELENYTVRNIPPEAEQKQVPARVDATPVSPEKPSRNLEQSEGALDTQKEESNYVIEVVLRRGVTETSTKQIQSPYG